MEHATINKGAAKAPTPSNKSLDYYKRTFLDEYLNRPGLTEIAINRPGEIFTEVNGVWTREENSIFTLDFCKRFSTVVAGFMKDEISDLKPILSGTIESGERIQCVYPKACQPGTVSITIRKPSTEQREHSQYIADGFYKYVMGHERKATPDQELEQVYRSGDIPRFIELAVKYGKTVLISGGTGSGKTTYMKSLIDFIPLETRLITIEDAEELKFFKHKNYVHLFYPSEAGNDPKAVVNAAKLLKACFRMKPDRILLAEIRGGEAWDFLKVVGSGHGGSMTSQHSGSVAEAIEGLVERCYQNTECVAIPYHVLKKKVLESIDVVVQVGRDGAVRYMSEIYFKNVDKHRFESELKAA